MNFDFEKITELGKEIKISPKTLVVQKADIVMIQIQIGVDYVASLVMAPEALAAIKRGEEIHIDTVKEFKTKYL
jgi:pyruvate/2-oxoacid:ferredoxin oxidoreductase beta subunit